MFALSQRGHASRKLSPSTVLDMDVEHEIKFLSNPSRVRKSYGIPQADSYKMHADLFPEPDTPNQERYREVCSTASPILEWLNAAHYGVPSISKSVNK